MNIDFSFERSEGGPVRLLGSSAGKVLKTGFLTLQVEQKILDFRSNDLRTFCLHLTGFGRDSSEFRVAQACDDIAQSAAR